MNVFDLLKEEHAETKRDIQQALGGQAQSGQQRIIQKICDNLNLHMQMEEKFLYPELERISDLKEQAAEAYDEHNEVKKVLKRLEGADQNDEVVEQHLSRLEELVNHHVMEEEQEVFPLAAKKISPDEIKRITQDVVQMKEKAVSSKG